MKMALFGRKNNKALPAPDKKELTDLEKILRHRFASASYGAYFRTVSFHFDYALDGDDIQWREACKVHGGWLIKTVHSVKNEDGKREYIIHPVNPERVMSFIDAAENLALYEAEMPMQGGVPFDINEQSALGDKHLKAFAEREGLAFDSHGVPHPTSDGFIITAGNFPPDAQDKALASYDAKKRPFAQLSPLALPPIAVNPDAQRIFNQITYMKQLKSTFTEVQSSLLRAWEKGWNSRYPHYESTADRFRSKTDDWSYDVNYALKSMFKDEGADVSHALRRAYDLMVMYGYVSICMSIQSGFDESFHSEENLNDYLSYLAHVLDDLGYQDVDPEGIILGLKKRGMVFDKEIEGIMTWFDDAMKVMEDQVALSIEPAPGAAAVKALEGPKK